MSVKGETCWSPKFCLVFSILCVKKLFKKWIHLCPMSLKEKLRNCLRNDKNKKNCESLACFISSIWLCLCLSNLEVCRKYWGMGTIGLAPFHCSRGFFFAFFSAGEEAEDWLQWMRLVTTLRQSASSWYTMDY